MMIGHVRIDEERGTVNTHRDSYRLDTITVTSVRRPFLAGGALCAVGIGGFGLAFGDLLYGHEVAIAIAVATASIGIGWQVGQLKLLSRDLRGSELSDAVWGQYARLNVIRLRIADAMAGQRKEGGA